MPRDAGRHSTSIRFDNDVYHQLLEESEDRDLSINWIVNRLVREGLTRLVPNGKMALTLGDDPDPT